MKRTIVGVAVVAGVVQLTAAPAQAALQLDPVKALQAELGRGKAVNVQSTAKVTYTRGMVATTSLEGTVGFGSRGAIASDIEQRLSYNAALLRNQMKFSPRDTELLLQGPIRMISAGGTSYVSGPVVERALQPQDADWVRYGRAALPSSNLLVEVLEPATLKTLVARRGSYRDGVVKGSIKATKLAAVSPAFASRYGTGTKGGRDGKIDYTLWLGADGLVERVAAKAVMPVDKKTSYQVESSTRFLDWGREVTVLVPLEGDVIDQKEVRSDVPETVPGIWN